MRAVSKQVRRYPDLALDALETSSLNPRDAAFAHAIYDTVLRRWLTLSHLIGTRLDLPFDRIEPRAAAALLVGACQIFLLDKVPVHSAVNASVEWAKAHGGRGGGGLVNAVLRRMCELAEVEEPKRQAWSDGRDELPLSDGEARALALDALPKDPVQRLSIATSTPVPLLRTWMRDYSTRESREFALHGLIHAPTILNTAHAQSDLPEGLEPHDVPGHHVFTGTHGELSTLLEARSDIWAQDPASSLPVASVADLNPKIVVDVCAGKGTKTRQLFHTFPEAEIIATDIDLVRRKFLENVFARTERVRILPYEKLIELAGAADLVLIDAPCSNTGVLARRIEARYRFSSQHLESLTSIQKQIIADAVRLVRGGTKQGRILYATCSLDPSENREQAAWAERWHSFRIEREHKRRPTGSPGDPPHRYTDGSYAALLS